MNRSIRTAAAVAASLACTGLQAQATDDPLRVTVGLRGWYAKYPGWVVVKGAEACSVVSVPGCLLPDQSLSLEPESRPLMAIPTVALRKGRWLLSSSYGDMGRMRITLLGQSGTLKRREADVVVGYAVLPSASLTLGYKDVRLNVDGLRTTYSGWTLGASGSARLSDAVSLYGNVAFGLPGRFRARLAPSDADALGRSDFDTDYEVIEVGLATPLTMLDSGPNPPILTFGYRSQRVTIPNYQLSTGIGLTFAQSLNDSTYGFVLGLSKTF